MMMFNKVLTILLPRTLHAVEKKNLKHFVTGGNQPTTTRPPASTQGPDRTCRDTNPYVSYALKARCSAFQ